MDPEHARRRAHNRARELRSRVASEAARLMTEHGVRDFHLAKLRAAERLGVRDEGSLPRNGEIEEALREYQRLFQAESQPRLLRTLRETAVEAMRFFTAFEPRLVGAVLDGAADVHSAVCLHLFCDDPAALHRFLDDNRIPFEEQSRRLRYDAEHVSEHPVYTFSADGVPMDLTVLPLDGLRQAPLDRVDGLPMRRASLGAVEALLKSDPGPGP